MLELHQVNKSYPIDHGEQVVLRGLDLSLEAGQSIALLGDSGSGKSTLLHLIAGLERADGGTIEFCGEALHEASESALAQLRRSDISIVFQQFHLIDTLSVIDNIRFQAHLCQRFDAAWEDRLLERLDLAQHLQKAPYQLSRGQQQRVAIARALLHRPKLILADEPTGNLDQGASLEVIRLFCDLVSESGCGLLMVTHSDTMAEYLDRRLHLQHGQLGPRR